MLFASPRGILLNLDRVFKKKKGGGGKRGEPCLATVRLEFIKSTLGPSLAD